MGVLCLVMPPRYFNSFELVKLAHCVTMYSAYICYNRLEKFEEVALLLAG